MTNAFKDAFVIRESITIIFYDIEYNNTFVKYGQIIIPTKNVIIELIIIFE